MFELIDFLIVRPIANILFVIYGFVGDFGLAIILLTLLVKLCIWPLTKRQIHQTRLQRKIQPELVEIKKRCNGNRQLESLQTMDLYKRYNIKPFRSLLMLILQFPIFIALYTAVRVMVLPTPSDNLELRAYAPVRELSRIDEVVQLQQDYLAEYNAYSEYQSALSSGAENLEPVAAPSYNFHPKLFGLVDLDVKPGFTSLSAFVMLLFAIGSAFSQYWISRQQLPSAKKKKSFRQLMKEAAAGQEPDQAELTQAMTGQMSFIMPVMMLLIMINLPGALVFYYCISNLFTGFQQRYLLNKKTEELEIVADKGLIKELKQIEEAEIVSEPSASSSRWVKNKNSTTSSDKAGAHVTHISVKSRRGSKHKRR